MIFAIICISFYRDVVIFLLHNDASANIPDNAGKKMKQGSSPTGFLKSLFGIYEWFNIR